MDDAQREYQFVIENSSDPVESSQSHNNLGVLFSQKNQLEEALRSSMQPSGSIRTSKIAFSARSIEYQRGKGMLPSRISATRRRLRRQRPFTFGLGRPAS